MWRRIPRTTRVTIWIILVAIAITVIGTMATLIAATPHLLSGLSTAREGMDRLITDPVAAGDAFTTAGTQFDASITSLHTVPDILLIPTLVPPFSWYVRLNKAAVYLTRAGGEAAELAHAYPTVVKSNDPSALVVAHSAAVESLLDTHADTLTSLAANLAAADAELQHIPSWAAVTHQSELETLKQVVHRSAKSLPEALQFVTALRHALGEGMPGSSPHTVLIVFQNDGELRPSGGFPGSYATLTATNGVIHQFSFGGDIYALDRDVAAAQRVVPPPQLQTIAPWMTYRDSTVGTGFLGDSAASLDRFFTRATGINPDLTVFVDLSVLEDILTITGPLALPGTDRVATPESLSTDLTTAVERDYWTSSANRTEANPKRLIADLMPVLVTALRQNPKTIRSLPGIIGNAVTRKSLQLWSRNDALEAVLANSFPTDTPQDGDWMKVVNTNIGGLKSSRNVLQDVSINETSHGSLLTRTVTITRTHIGTGIWPDADNRNYLEVYLPASADVTVRPDGNGGENHMPAELIAYLGSTPAQYPGEVRHTDQWTRLGFWATTRVGEKTTYTFSYTLPSSYTGPFTYLKQAGSRNETLSAFGASLGINSNVVLEKPWHFW